MAPRTRSPEVPLPPEYVRVSPELEARLRCALEESERDPGRALTPEELRRMAETGEWPAWCDSSD
jgi:hypothetical protein